MIKYSEIKQEEFLRVVGSGVPGFAANGEMVKAILVTPNSVIVENREGRRRKFVNYDGAKTLEKIN